MATIKSYTDLEQSKKLAEFLPLESADMCYPKDAFEYNYAKEPVCHYSGIGLAHPCWSLAALLDIMPHIQEFYPTIEKINDKFVCRYRGSGIWTNGTNPVDACFETVLKLHELNLL